MSTTTTSTKTRQIAIAVDPLSDEANKTIDWAIENFLRPTDEIHAIMVMVLDAEFGELGNLDILGTTPGLVLSQCYIDSPDLPPTDSFDTIEKEITSERTKAMEDLVNKIKQAGFKKVKKHIFKTDSTHACNVLIDYLDTESMNCLIMGSRNLSGWKRFFMGSFSDYVQSHVHCPVLIVK